MKTTSAFPEPSHTQTPNNFFEMIPNMSDAELRVTLVMIRNTFGWHKDNFKMGINKLADAAGLSRNGAKDGAEAAEKRGTFRRTNPNDQTEAEWELVVGQPVTTLTDRLGGGQPVTINRSASDQQVGVKERKESNKENGAEAPILSDMPIEWQIAGNSKGITIHDQEQAKRIDFANLVAMNTSNRLESYHIAVAFQNERNLTLPESKVKGQRRAIREMLEMGVKAIHVREATRQLIGKGMTVADLFSVSKTAIDLANKQEVLTGEESHLL